MSKTTQTPVRPDGVNVSITEAGMIALEFDHADVPPIVLSQGGTERVASYLHSAASRIGEPDDSNNE